ncbi:MAG: flagellar biosynthesis anti-sigma factor FlgM [Nitrospirota bacterium]|nr:MAG: flagellar biosynthesis anti-sigma factor FlgM [Nitrospirota bacterium]
MNDPHSNSRPTQDSSSPSGPRSKPATAHPVSNHKEPISKALPPDPIDLADQSALIRFVQEEAKRIPDIRQDRIDQIRAALQSRKYHISSDLIADQIIQDILLDEPSAQH